MKVVYLLIFALFFTACMQENSAVPQKRQKSIVAKNKEYVSDLKNFEQNVSAYIDDSFQEHQIASLESYETYYFTPWNREKITISLDDAMWAYRTFDENNSYGDNLQPLKRAFFTHIKEYSNYQAYATLNKKAITLKRVNLRAFPTDKPLFLDPKKAGEGFPFDYLQNSLIAANKPLLVSHYSKDRAWVFVQASFAYGWIPSDTIAFVPDRYAKLYQEAKKDFLIKEGRAIYDEEQNYLFDSRIGMMLPVISYGKESDSVLTMSHYKNIHEALYNHSKIQKDIFHRGILKFNKKNIVTVFNAVSKVRYGWGGIYGERDCSSILRDFYAPFGLWLPRNSSAQSKIGRVISFDGMSDEEKIQTIKKYGVAFETLLYKRGHILLYVGIKEGNVVVFHNTWGVKTKENQKEGRFIIGKPVFSSLMLGSNLKNYDKNASILSHLKSMNILTQ